MARSLQLQGGADHRDAPNNKTPNKKRKRGQSRRKSQTLEKHSGVKRLSLSPEEWCAANNYSRSFYEKLKREGRGPDEVCEGKTRRITPEADARWKAARTVKASASASDIPA